MFGRLSCANALVENAIELATAMANFKLLCRRKLKVLIYSSIELTPDALLGDLRATIFIRKSDSVQ
jgi:hypothetical protein